MAGLAIAAIIAVFVVAEGGGGGDVPLNAIAKAAEITQREPGGRAVFHVTVDAATTTEGLTEDGSMTFDDSGRSRATIHFKGHSTDREGEMLAVTDGLKTYLNSDLFDSLPDGKNWMEVDLSAAGGPSEPVSSQSGPNEGLKILEKVIGAKEKGTEEVDGVSTTRYVGTLPVADEVFGLKPDISKSSIEVWIDAQERVRRMQLDLTGGVKGAPDSVATTAMTIDFVEFGGVPAIALPEPEEVVDVTGEIEESLQSAAAGN